MDYRLKKVLGGLLWGIGCIGIIGLLFFYGVLLFSNVMPSLQPLHEAFRLMFTIPTGIVVLYASFVILFIPLLSLVLIGAGLYTNSTHLTTIRFVVLCCIWVTALLFCSATLVHQMQQLSKRMSPFSQDPIAFDVTALIPLEVQYVFKTTIKNEVNSRQGVTSVDGYVPAMFLDTFPGLTESDFEGVEASIGMYTMMEGRLVHKMDDTRLVHDAAKIVTDRGLDTLLSNVSVRLGVDLRDGGTLTEIMEALTRYSRSDEPPSTVVSSSSSVTVPKLQETVPTDPQSPVACTMDAKICPDGSAVGRTGPACAFAPCPLVTPATAHVCTPEEKRSKVCTREYAPVCGSVAVQCVTTPCPAVKETFSNGCTACGQGNVISYTRGVCTL